MRNGRSRPGQEAASTDKKVAPTQLQFGTQVSVDASPWAARQQRAAACNSWTPWLEFLDTARVELTPDLGALEAWDRPSALWRSLQPAVARQLDAAGLTASVVTTAGACSLDAHHPDLAGHVMLTRVDGTPADDALDELVWNDGDEDLAARFGFRLGGPAHRGLHQFCGQYIEPGLDVDLRTTWFDHPSIWTDDQGRPVLALQPYGDPAAVWADIAATILELGLPLTVEGPHPSARSDNANLFLLRFDPRAPMLTAAAGDPTAAPMAERCSRHFGCIGVACTTCGRCDCDVPVCGRCLGCADHAPFANDTVWCDHVWWRPSDSKWISA